MPSLYFDGTDYLETTLTAISTGLNTYTMFMVWKQTNSSTTQVIFHQRGPSTGCNGNFAGVYTNTTGYINGWACGFGDTQAFTYRANTPYTTTYRVDNSVTNNVTLYTNGSKYGPVQRSGINVGENAMAVGYGGVDDTFYFIGMISEVIIYNRALKDEEITSVRDYLTKKYGFTA
ncbi:MAG: hypothetical protein KGQ36_03980 [Rickettsiales bacterium]|nr:hypothetical protein [Rickettsiales bacterium]